ncbi:MAG: hypothetical protein ABWX73_03095 [Marmoricola sp.]
MSTAASSESNSWAKGVVILAGTLLVTSGLVQVLQGIAAIANDELFVTTPSYAFELDVTAWGWIQVFLGVVLVLTGYFLFAGQGWARVVALILAVASLLSSFMFLPHYPLWALVVITLDIAIIWAISTFIAPPAWSDDKARPGVY